MDLSTPLQFVKGIGPARAEILAAKQLTVVRDLLFYLPFRYEDRRNIKAISELAPGEKATVLARVGSAKLASWRRSGGSGLFEAVFEDGSGARLTARWFHGERFADTLVGGVRVALYGKVELETGFKATRLMVQPEIEILRDGEDDKLLHSACVLPVYEAAGKIGTRVFRRLIDHVLNEAPSPEDALPESVRTRMQLPDLGTALRTVHLPPDDANIDLLNQFRSPAQTRLIFEELFWLECGLALKRSSCRKSNGISFSLTPAVREKLKAMLPFKPTQAQKRALGEIASDMALPHPMNRLLQGDVGSGKTIVAAQAAVIAIENGYQAAVLAPTEILTVQHFENMRRLMSKIGYTAVALTGSMTAREKQQAKGLLSSGMAQLAIGTQALIQEDVEFKNLGLAIVDEQHRFGVRQRLSLMRKGLQPDVLVMTATPIPRTLALTLYGDLEVSVIDQLPPGRKPVLTKAIPRDRADLAYNFVRKQVATGRQAYIVYPVVEESESLADVRAAERMYEHLSSSVFSDIKVGLLHGRLPPDQKEAVMRDFCIGAVEVLVSTTVIEVGVDVPNATVMLIEEAERFGLAQIHQLRGRIGRGAHKSYCLLLTGKLNDVARQRIATLVASNDGFHIAEMDLRLRGPGEFYGTKQAGVPGLHIADLIRDADILELARKEAEALIADPQRAAEVQDVIRYIQEHWQRRYGLAQVG